jgi:hypothetical protein
VRLWDEVATHGNGGAGAMSRCLRSRAAKVVAGVESYLQTERATGWIVVVGVVASTIKVMATWQFALPSRSLADSVAVE